MSLPDMLKSYPAVLTNKDWQNKKGVIAKAAGETGVGAALDAAERAYGNVDWSLFSANTIKGTSREAIEGAFKKAQAEYKSVEVLRKALQQAATVAGRAAASFKKNKFIPSSAAKAAAAVESAAKSMDIACKSIDWKDFDARLERFQKLDKLNGWRAFHADREFRAAFLKFVQKRTLSDELDFLLKDGAGKVAEANAQKLFDLYIAPGAKKELNLPGSQVKAYREALEAKDWKAAEKARKAIYTRVDVDFAQVESEFRDAVDSGTL